MATIHDVAKLAKVSPGTVSKYINGNGYVAPDTRARIKAAIESLNYKPNKNARLLKSGKPEHIAFIVPSIDNSLILQFYEGLLSILSKSNFSLTVFETGDYAVKEEEILSRLSENNFAGVVICTCQTCESESLCHLVRDFPTIFIHRRPSLDNISYFGFDQMNLVYDITMTLISNGITDICLCTNDAGYSSDQECIRGFQTAIIKNGLALRPESIFSFPYLRESAHRSIMEILNSKHCPKAFITSHDILASTISEVAQMLGLWVGKDIFIVSLGQSSWYQSIFFKEIVYTFRPAHKLGVKAAESMLRLIDSPAAFENVNYIMHDSFPSNRVSGFLNRRDFGNPGEKRRTPIKLCAINLFDNMLGMQCLAKRYSKMHGTEIVIESLDYWELYEKLLESEKTGKFEYDLISADLLWVPYLASKGIIADITDSRPDMIASVEQRCIYGFFNISSQYNGRVYGVPESYGTELMFFRSDLFADHAIQRQFYDMYQTKLEIPQNYYDFNRVARFFTRAYNPESPTLYGTSLFLDSSLCPDLYSRMWYYGGSLFDDKGNVTLYSSSNVKAFSNYLDTLACSSPDHGISSLLSLSEGKVAMMVTYCANAPFILDKANSQLPGKIGYTHVPAKYSIVAGGTLAISAFSREKEQVLDFLNWFSSDEVAMSFAMLGGTSAMKNVYDFPEIYRSSPWMSEAIKAFPHCRQRSMIVKSSDPPLDPVLIEGAIKSALLAAYYDGVPVEEALLRSQRKLEDYFESLGYSQRRLHNLF